MENPPQTTEPILSVHPVDDAVRTRIEKNLTDIETRHQVTILFACESGSRGWGFASKDSDYDVRFVYVHKLPWYLQVHHGRDVIEKPISDELDISGWELRKTLGLIGNANPVLLEWLQSPIVYRKADPWTQRLHDLALEGFAPARAWHHYISMARKTWDAYLKGENVRHKKYFYALRPLLAARWIQDGHGSETHPVPPMRFAALASKVLSANNADNQTLIDEINTLLTRKMQSIETASGPRWPAMHNWIEQELRQAQRPGAANNPHISSSALDDFLYQAVLHFDG